MNSTLKKGLIFSIGLVIGAFAGATYAKKRINRLDNEEIEKIKEMYKQKYEVTISKEKQKLKPEEKYEKIACEYHTAENPPKKKKNPDIKIINAVDFGENFAYDTVSLTYYADNVLAYDVNDEMVTDIENTVGIDNLAKIKEYYDDAMYVRNDISRVYYEIMPSEKTYAEETGWIPEPE